MAGGALTLSVGLSAASRLPFPPRRGNPGGPQQPRLESSPTCAGWGPGSHRAGLGAPRIGEGAPGTPSGEGRWEAREAGRARSAPALVGGCEQVAVGVCRACQQLCQERLARARAQEAGSCQPLARAVRGVRTPPPIGAHTASSRTPTSSWGWGSPRTKEGEGALVERAGGEGALLSQPLFRAKSRTLLLASGISPSFKPPPHLELTGPGLGQMGLAPAS